MEIIPLGSISIYSWKKKKTMYAMTKSFCQKPSNIEYEMNHPFHMDEKSTINILFKKSRKWKWKRKRNKQMKYFLSIYVAVAHPKFHQIRILFIFFSQLQNQLADVIPPRIVVNSIFFFSFNRKWFSIIFKQGTALYNYPEMHDEYEGGFFRCLECVQQFIRYSHYSENISVIRNMFKN